MHLHFLYISLSLQEFWHSDLSKNTVGFIRRYFLCKNAAQLFIVRRFSLLKKRIIEKSCTKLKFTLILKEFRFVQRLCPLDPASCAQRAKFSMTGFLASRCSDNCQLCKNYALRITNYALNQNPAPRRSAFSISVLSGANSIAVSYEITPR